MSQALFFMNALMKGAVDSPFGDARSKPINEMEFDDGSAITWAVSEDGKVDAINARIGDLEAKLAKANDQIIALRELRVTDRETLRRQLNRAEEALRSAGFTYEPGAVAWKPPVNQSAKKLHALEGAAKDVLDEINRLAYGPVDLGRAALALRDALKDINR